jgi:hypothetical protein
VFAGIQGGQRRLAMPMIASGDGDGVNILHRQQFLVILENFDIAADDFCGLLLARLGKIAHRDLLDVVLAAAFLLVWM